MAYIRTVLQQVCVNVMVDGREMIVRHQYATKIVTAEEIVLNPASANVSKVGMEHFATIESMEN